MARTFVLTYIYTPDVALQDANRSAHIDHLRALADAGTLVVSGPWGPDDTRGGMHVYRAEDRAAVQTIIDNDPFMIRWSLQRRSASWCRCSGRRCLLSPASAKDRDHAVPLRATCTARVGDPTAVRTAPVAAVARVNAPRTHRTTPGRRGADRARVH